MKALAEFSKTTLIGGVLIVLPISVSLLVLAKAAKGLLALLKPDHGRDTCFRQVSRDHGRTRARRRLFRRGGDRAYPTGPAGEESLRARAVLERLPGYALLRGLAARFTGQAGAGSHLRQRLWR